MAEGEQDRAELPTPFKLMRARRKGAVARGTDLGFFTGLAAFLGYAWISGQHLSQAMTEAIRGVLMAGTGLAAGHYAVLSAVALLFASVAPPLVLMGGTIFLVVLLFEIIQTGFVFSAEPLKPDFSRINPANGLKRLFSLRLLIETLKNILKLSVYASVGYWTIRSAVQSDLGMIVDGHALAALITTMVFRLIASFVGIALLFAILDQIIVRWDFLKKMRMSRRELRRELREREGDPRLRQKRKQLHAEFVKASQSLRNLRKADVLISNPEHIALALHYDQRSMDAPCVVSMGTNRFAQRLKRLAFIFSVPVIENRALARELYRRSRLNRPIPEHCYRPVADIYKAIRRKDGGKTAEQHND